MILWIADRFGIPGNYHRIWLRLLVGAGLQPQEFRVFKLSNALPRTLLTRLGSRKAPTWVPEEKPSIVRQIDSWCDQLKPRAVVLSSPESLAYLDMAPEHATLHNLRGSVYWRRGIPFIVSLPLSAWTSLVSQKDIGAANYGYESAEAFGAARSEDGEVYEDSDQRISRSFDNREFPGGAGSSDGNESQPEARRHQERTLPSAGTRLELDIRQRNETATATDADSETDSDDDDEAEDNGVDGSSDDSVDGDGDRSDAGVSGGDISLATDDEDDKDRFFYEPVLSPVGRFVLTADMQKLFRILDKGKRSSGPSEPIRLKY